MILLTLLILAVSRTHVTYEPSNGLAHLESLSSLVVRAPNWHLGGHGLESCRGLRFFLGPMVVAAFHLDHLFTRWQIYHLSFITGARV